MRHKTLQRRRNGARLGPKIRRSLAPEKLFIKETPPLTLSKPAALLSSRRSLCPYPPKKKPQNITINIQGREKEPLKGKKRRENYGNLS